MATNSQTPGATREGLAVTMQVTPLFLPIEQAAAYMGIGPTLFRAMVADKRIPEPLQLGSKRGATGRGVRSLWYRPALDAAAHKLAVEADEDELVA